MNYPGSLIPGRLRPAVPEKRPSTSRANAPGRRRGRRGLRRPGAILRPISMYDRCSLRALRDIPPPPLSHIRPPPTPRSKIDNSPNWRRGRVPVSLFFTPPPRSPSLASDGDSPWTRGSSSSSFRRRLARMWIRRGKAFTRRSSRPLLGSQPSSDQQSAFLLPTPRNFYSPCAGDTTAIAQCPR